MMESFINQLFDFVELSGRGVLKNILLKRLIGVYGQNFIFDHYIRMK